MAPDGNGIAATAIILFNGDAGCIAGPGGTEAATSAGEKDSSEEKRNVEETGFRVECLRKKGKTDPACHTGLISTAVISFTL